MGRLKAVGNRVATLAPRVMPPPKRADSFYASPEWRALVRDIKAERGPWCVRCGSGQRIIGDHIRELKDGGAALDPANVQLLCHGCHQRKTADARAARARGDA